MPEERPAIPQRPMAVDRTIGPERTLVSDRSAGTPVPAVEPEAAPQNGARSGADFEILRDLLVGPERHRIAELSGKVDALELTPDSIATHLPEAIALRTSSDQRLGRALAPTVETALRESIRRNPREIATAIFPVLGPAIRKAIAETMAGLVRSINSAVEHSLSVRGLKWRVEGWRTGVPYAEIVIKHALVYRVEQVFLIHAESGLLLSHVAAAHLQVADADLISSMLTAIQDFVRDSFRPDEGGTLRTFTVGEHTVHVEAGPRALIAAVVRGEAPETVTQRLQSTLESVHLEFASPLIDFEGDPTPFQPVRPLLEECLETVLSTDRRPGTTTWVWLRWAIPLAALALLGAGMALRSRSRWQRAVAALNAEPGIVVVGAKRGWGEWSFTGLKDPLAREPRAVLLASGFTPRSVSGRWESYLSLDSAVVVERAKRTLGVPGSALVSLRADTFVVAGSVPIDWLATAGSAATPPGVAAIDASAVRPTLPPALDSLKQTLEGARVLFDPGSWELTAGGSRSVRAAADAIRSLVDGVASLGASISVVLVGRTDPTGTNETNQALAQLRADQIGARLIALGVPSARIDKQAVATSRPLEAADDAQRARINRSVSFEVTVDTGRRTPRTRGQ